MWLWVVVVEFGSQVLLWPVRMFFWGWQKVILVSFSALVEAFLLLPNRWIDYFIHIHILHSLLSLAASVPYRVQLYSKVVFLNLNLIALIQQVTAYRRGARITFLLKCGHFILKFWHKTRNFAKSCVTHLGPRQNRLCSTVLPCLELVLPQGKVPWRQGHLEAMQKETVNVKVHQGECATSGKDSHRPAAQPGHSVFLTMHLSFHALKLVARCWTLVLHRALRFFQNLFLVLLCNKYI